MSDDASDDDSHEDDCNDEDEKETAPRMITATQEKEQEQKRESSKEGGGSVDTFEQLVQQQSELELKLHQTELALKVREAALVQRELDLFEWAKRVNETSGAHAQMEDSGEYFIRLWGNAGNFGLDLETDFRNNCVIRSIVRDSEASCSALLCVGDALISV